LSLSFAAMARVVVFLLCAVPVTPFHATTGRLGLNLVGSRLRSVLNSEGVTRLSEIEDEDKKRQGPKPWERYLEEQAGVTQEGINPTHYDGFIDDDGFDGGDGQVGVVGDGKNHMEEFDKTAAVKTTQSRGRVMGGSESKKNRANVFGYTTGYAEQLKEQGMTQVDEYGDDRLAARRQQLENWRNQRELKSNQVAQLQELAEYTGVAYDPRYGAKTYHDALNKKGTGVLNDDAKFTMVKGEAKKDKLEAPVVGLVAGDITQTLEISCQFPKPSFHEIVVENDVISYEEFKVGFAEGSDESDFQISPVSGELKRRGSEPQILSLVFKPNAPGGTREAKIVVETEESKWTYHVIATVM